MERNDLADRFGRLRRQLSDQGCGVSDNLGFQFEKMSLNDGVSDNMVSSSPRIRAGVDRYAAGGDNLVPGVYGFGSVNKNVGTGTNDMMMMYKNNAYFNRPPLAVGSPFGSVHGDYEAYYQNIFYQTEVQRAHMIEFVSRKTASSVLDVSPNAGHKLVAVDSHGAVNFMELRGQILGLAMTQYGCKMLQMRIGEIDEEEIEMVLEEIGDNFSSLMMDQFGNYFVQKLVEVCNEEQRTRIISSVTKHPYQLICVCLNLHGTRAVQKLLECLTSEDQISMVKLAIIPGVVPLIKDSNACHVIQHCLKYFSDAHNGILINEIARNCYEIATDKSGCCVLQLCVDITKGDVKQHLISQITANALQLSFDRYGNYVVQHLLLMKVPSVTANLVDELQGHFFLLACNKYGSNVVEKCLTETSNEFSELVILELLKTPGVSKLLQDPFGNYVFQSALSVSQGLLHNALVSLVEKHAAYMSSNLYGKKVLAWFDNRKRLGNMRS